MVIPKQVKRGDDGRYRSVDLVKSGRSSVQRSDPKKDEVMEPIQHVYGPLQGDFIMEQEDDEICEKCKRKYVEGKEKEDVMWIGCDFDGCNKWYHSDCVDMTNEECQ